MCKVVHWINAPRGPGMMMLRVANPVEDGIPYPNVRSSHIDLGAQRARPVWKLPAFHPREQVEILFDRPVPKGAVLPWTIWRTAVFVGLFSREIIHIRQALE